MGRLYLSLSYPFNVGFFSFILCAVAIQLVSGFLSKGLIQCLVADSVCVGGGDVRLFLCEHLGTESNL